jgi:hypothetical protein
VFVAGYSDFASESEFVLDRGHQLKIRRIEEKLPSGLRKLALESLPPDKRSNEDIKKWVMKREGYDPTRRVYLCDIVGSKKNVSDADAKDLPKFIARHEPPKAPIPKLKPEVEQSKNEPSNTETIFHYDSTKPHTKSYENNVYLHGTGLRRYGPSDYEENKEIAKSVPWNYHLYLDLDEWNHPLIMPLLGSPDDTPDETPEVYRKRVITLDDDAALYGIRKIVVGKYSPVVMAEDMDDEKQKNGAVLAAEKYATLIDHFVDVRFKGYPDGPGSFIRVQPNPKWNE